MRDDQLALLREIDAAWPDAFTVHPETDALWSLRDLQLIDIYDMWPDGRRRWTLTSKGHSALGAIAGESEKTRKSTDDR